MKNLLITGATSGIGLHAARFFAAQGNRLCLVGRSEEKITELKNELGGNHIYIKYDFGNPGDVESILHEIKENRIKLDGLVYCAGIGSNHGIRGIDLNDSIQMYKVNFESYLALCSHFIRKEYSNDGASIVGIASITVRTCYPGTASYCSSKAAMISLNKILSKEVLRRKIRVNTILPAYVNTPMSGGMPDDKLLSEQPWGYLETEDVVNAIDFLVSDKSKMITGSELVISGGMTF